MRSVSAAAAASFSLAALAWLPVIAHGQDDLPRDGDDRPVLGELPLAPLERYYANPPGVTVETFLEGLDVAHASVLAIEEAAIGASEELLAAQTVEGDEKDVLGL